MLQFQRQMLLPQIGEQGQKIISEAKVLIVGAGGLGHPAAQYLTAMGVGTIGIIDGDEVQESNLHRQILFSKKDLNSSKAFALTAAIKNINPALNVLAYPVFLNKEKALEIFPDYDVIIDGTDNFATKFLINDVCCFYNKPMIYGALSQFEGQVSTFWKGHGPCYRCLYKDIPKARIQNCAEAGVLGALPGVIGSIQALETIKVLIAQRKSTNTLNPLKKFCMTFKEEDLHPLIGKIQFFNFLNNQLFSLNLKPNPQCLCQRENLLSEDIQETMMTTCHLPKTFLLLDVREEDEWQDFHIQGSQHWALSKIENGELPIQLKDETVVSICRSGQRAERAAELLKQNGFSKISFTRGSIYEYQTK
ncbi:MAG: ThiF family adenylyltransferase [Pseudobdellovibrionaceae bacterium]